MAELTLQRIAELRGIATVCVEEGEHWSIGPAELLRLLDAAERGLLADRKAAAFDRLAAMVSKVPSWISIDKTALGFEAVLYRYDEDERSGDAIAPTLLEAIEALPQTNGEPKHD